MTDVRRFWEHEAEKHASVAYRYNTVSGARYPFYEIRRDRILELLGGSDGRKLLDAGCGTARLLIECIKGGWDGEGCDAAPKMVEIARGELKAHGISPDRVTHQDITDLAGYESYSFDAIICAGVLEYLTPEEDAAAFTAFARVLKPGGVLIVENINALFDLVTFNRFTLRFIDEQFVSMFFGEQERIAIREELRRLVAHPDKPDPSGIYSTVRDRVYTKSENPLTYSNKVRAIGFEESDRVYYRFHAVPPLLFENNPRYEAFAIPREDEYKRHWAGTFLATGFISLLRPVAATP